VPDTKWFPARGTVEPGFEAVHEAFVGVLSEQRGTGAALAVCHQGRWIVDLWGGSASADGTLPWQPETIVQPYSVSKPSAAVCGRPRRKLWRRVPRRRIRHRLRHRDDGHARAGERFENAMRECLGLPPI